MRFLFFLLVRTGSLVRFHVECLLPPWVFSICACGVVLTLVPLFFFFQFFLLWCGSSEGPLSVCFPPSFSFFPLVPVLCSRLAENVFLLEFGIPSLLPVLPLGFSG